MQCPDCGNTVNRNPIDIGVGEIYEPMFCECCGWVEPTYEDIIKEISEVNNTGGGK